MVLDAQGSVGTLPVRIVIVDKNDSIIVEDNATTFTLSKEESVADSSASSDAFSSALTVKNGVAEIEVADSQAETVTLTPASTPVLEPASGKVTFGTLGSSGMRIILWREKK
jgi:ribulose kinase